VLKGDKSEPARPLATEDTYMCTTIIIIIIVGLFRIIHTEILSIPMATHRDRTQLDITNIAFFEMKESKKII
jgi:hypothetical protein